MNDLTIELISVYLENKTLNDDIISIDLNSKIVTNCPVDYSKSFNAILIIDDSGNEFITKLNFNYKIKHKDEIPTISKFINLINTNYDFAALLNNYIELWVLQNE